jgi:hypothetical protein
LGSKFIEEALLKERLVAQVGGQTGESPLENLSSQKGTDKNGK